jgi:uncharacterized protein YjhX (UPF0386 family)
MRSKPHPSQRETRSPQLVPAPFAHRAAAVALAVACALSAGTAAAAAVAIGSMEIISRAEGRTLPVYKQDGRQWIVGTPGQEYGIRVCNATGERVLAVMSVDGVNIVSGETASPSQSGYVLSANECYEIDGWRKSNSTTAAFYFTELPDAYATRTGRPDNVGVIGVAFFREKPQRVSWKDAPRIAAVPPPEPVARQDAGAPAAPARAAEAQANDAARPLREAAGAAAATATPAPAPLAKIGTGHGRSEQSYVQNTRFERESAMPNLTLAINYDRRENLVAMGILPPPWASRNVNPFPAWPGRFVPDPPAR